MSEGAPGAAPLPLEVGGCHIECESGAGPAARTYRARRGGRVLAVRVFDPGVRLDRAVLERFLIGRPDRIRHPNLPALEALGEHDGRMYYATKFPRGDSLRRLLEELELGRASSPSLSPLAVGPGGTRHPDFVPRAVKLVAEASDGLEAAHREGIVHGRLAPERLILSPSGRLVITGFGEATGTAKMSEKSRAGGGAAARELACRSPEELRGEPVTPAADVHALGVILYELLTLELPFRGRSPREVRRAILRGEIVPPREARPDTPRALELPILRALAPAASERYPTAGGLARDLERFLRGELSPEPGDAPRRPVAIQRRPRVVRGLAATLIVAGAAASATLGLRVANEGDSSVLTSLDPASRRELSPALRAATLDALADELRLGRVKAEAVDRVAGALRDQDPRVARAAFRLFASSASSDQLLRGLRAGDGPLTLAPERFLLLHHALVEIADEGARTLIAGWTLEIMQALDRLGPGQSLEVSPGLEVRVPLGRADEADSAGRGGFTSAWVEGASRLDPASLLDAAPRLAAEDPAPATLLDALSFAARTESHRKAAVRSIERMVHAGYTRWGRDGIRALARLGASSALLRLVQSWLPPLLREEALDALLESSPEGRRDALEDIALGHPDGKVRGKALAYLVRSEAKPRAGASRLILRALGDPGLRRDALERLGDLERGERSRTALFLLEHADAAVRERAVEILASDPDPALFPSLLLRCLDSRSRTRSAAIAALARRDDAARVSRSACGLFRRAFEDAPGWTAALRRVPSEGWKEARAALRSSLRIVRTLGKTPPRRL